MPERHGDEKDVQSDHSVDVKVLADKMLQDGWLYGVDEAAYSDVALELMRRGRGTWFADNMGAFRNLSAEVARCMVENDLSGSADNAVDLILKHQHLFSRSEYKTIVVFLLEQGFYERIRKTELFLKFSRVGDEDVILACGEQLLVKGFWRVLRGLEAEKERELLAAWLIRAYHKGDYATLTDLNIAKNAARHGEDQQLKRILQEVGDRPDVLEAEAAYLLGQGNWRSALGHGKLAPDGTGHWGSVPAEQYLSQPKFKEAWKECLAFSLVTDDDEDAGHVTAYARRVGGLGEAEVVKCVERAAEESINLWARARQFKFLKRKFPTIFEDDVAKKEALMLLDDPGIDPSLRRSKEFVSKIFDPGFSHEALRARQTSFLSPAEWQAVHEMAPEALTPDEKGRMKFAELAAALREYMVKAGEDASILEQLDRGVEIFGAGPVLRYMSRPDLTRHDALHFMPNIIALYENSVLSAGKFSGAILEQVASDDASYESGTAHHHFALVAQALQGVDVAQQLREAQEHAGSIKALAVLAKEFSDPAQGPFSSWKKLKKFKELVDILSRRDLLARLAKEPNHKLRAYVETLAFHPNISMESVFQFWEKTDEFLDITDGHTPEAIREVKKPSELLTVPHLGWQPADLRDALVGRAEEERSVMDRLQVLPAMERVYRIGPEPLPAERPRDATVLHQMLVDGIGKLREKQPGHAKKPKQLLGAVQGFCKDWSARLTGLSHPLAFDHLVKNPDLGPKIIAQLPDEARQALLDVLFHPDYGVELKAEDRRQIYRVRLGWKSDPSIATAGNETASCMPFGSGKQNHYMFNPNCVQLIVERQTSSGQWRTAAQSVVTLDYRSSKPTQALLESYQAGATNLHDLVEAHEFAQRPVVVCDNIEVAKNEEGERIKAVQEVYERFWRDYLREHAQTLSIDPRRVPIGTGYTPTTFTFPKQPNHYIPAAPMGYSDNAGAECFVLETGIDGHQDKDKDKVEKREAVPVAPVTIRDVLACAYLEGKAFANNPRLITHLHNMQNKIMGMAMANEYFQRPNLAFLYRTPDHIPRGYLFAYEGVTDEGREPFVYIEDFAADPNQKIAGGRLLRQFFEAFKRAYVDKQPPEPIPPIFTNARESTSYSMIQTHVARLASRLGVHHELVELGTHDQGGESFHDVAIIFGRTEAEVQAQKRRYAGKFVS